MEESKIHVKSEPPAVIATHMVAGDCLCVLVSVHAGALKTAPFQSGGENPNHSLLRLRTLELPPVTVHQKLLQELPASGRV